MFWWTACPSFDVYDPLLSPETELFQSESRQLAEQGEVLTI